MENKIYQGKDLAKLARVSTHEKWIKFMCVQPDIRKRIKPWSGKVCSAPIYAFINRGRWLGRCECGGAEYVDDESKIFFCFSCGNEDYKSDARPVIFPADKNEIETLILARPVEEGKGKIGHERAIEAKPVIPGLGRDYNAGETVQMLKDQNKAIRTWKAKK